MHTIYKIINKINNKLYIGQSKAPNGRWRNHKSSAQRVKNGAKLGDASIQVIHIAMAKHGIENFEFVALEELDTQVEANEREKYLVEYYDSLKSGYNSVPGGKVVSGFDHPAYGKPGPWLGKKRSKETCEKISKAKKGKFKRHTGHFQKGQESWNKGIQVSEESKHKMSESQKLVPNHPGKFQKGCVPWIAGKNQTEEAKIKCSEANRGKHLSPATEFKKGHKHSEESKKRMSESSKGQNAWNKKEFKQEELEQMKTLRERGFLYKEIGAIFNCSGQVISRCLKNNNQDKKDG